MPRRPKPYVNNGWYCTGTGNGKHNRLCPVSDGLRQAELILAQLIVAKAKQGKAERTAQAHGGATLKQAAECFLDFIKTERRAGTYDFYHERLAPFVARFGHKAAGKLTLEEGLAYKRWLVNEKEWKKGRQTVKGVSPGTVGACLVAAKTLLNWISKPSRRATYGLTSSPWEEISLPDPRKRKRVAGNEEFQALLSQAKHPDYHDMLLTLRYTALRPGNVRNLRWENVQLDRHRLLFHPDETKTHEHLSVPLLPVVEEMLDRRRHEAQGLSTIPPAGYVFQRVTGQPYASNQFAGWFHALFKRCAKRGLIQLETNGERLVLYSMRHTRLSEMFMEGHDTPIVQEVAGHASPLTTQRYKHLSLDPVTRAVRMKFGQRIDTA